MRNEIFNHIKQNRNRYYSELKKTDEKTSSKELIIKDQLMEEDPAAHNKKQINPNKPLLNRTEFHFITNSLNKSFGFVSSHSVSLFRRGIAEFNKLNFMLIERTDRITQRFYDVSSRFFEDSSEYSHDREEFNFTSTTRNFQNSDKDTLKFFNNRTRQIIAQTETLKYELQRTKENYGVSLVKLCKQIVLDKSIEKDRKYSLSYGALEKIKNYKSDIKDLETIINESIAYAESLFVDELSNIEIKEWHILTELPAPAKKPGIPDIQQTDLFGKSVSLLDKLESAALIVTSNHLKLTGTNVGKACPVPISAPAISDALYNHKSKINKLLKMYPDKWETIRNDFRPLKNILKDQDD